MTQPNTPGRPASTTRIDRADRTGYRSTMNRVIGLVSVVSLLSLGACEQKGGPLRVDKVEPDQGASAGNEQVTIHGAGFEPGKTQVEVRFGRRKAEHVSIASPTKITVITPAGDRGPVDVTLMFDNGAPFWSRPRIDARSKRKPSM